MSTYTAIILAGGSGKRMGGDIPKQYLPLCGKPLLYYPLQTFEKSDVDEIILVVASGDEDYCRTEIVERYGFTKVRSIVPGGKERYDSVYQGLQQASGDYVLVHDGARAFITTDVIHRTMEAVARDGACIVAVPVKDTIKQVDSEGNVIATPDRNTMWTVQTPQAFRRDILVSSYNKLQDDLMGITDDAMIVERAGNGPVKVVLGNYENIKITTPEDMVYGEAILSHKLGSSEGL